MEKLRVIWIDRDIYNDENTGYTEELEALGTINLKLFKVVDEAINYIKKVTFDEVKIIVSGRLYNEFVQSFKANIREICVAPIIKVFTGSEERFLQYNEEYYDYQNAFYNCGGIATIIDEIKEFLDKEKNKNSFFISQFSGQSLSTDITLNSNTEDEPTKFDKQDEVELTFEYIDCLDKLELPMLFKSLMDKIPYNDIEENTKSIYDEYSNNKEIKNLLGPILSLPNIPIEILSKYFARLYSLYSDYHFDLNKNLRLNKKEKYLPFIKILYEGVKLKSLPLATNKILYRGSIISNKEIDKIKKYKADKIKGLPASIVFSKSFLSFTKDRKIAEKFFKNEEKKENHSKIMFILEKDDNEGYDTSTHGDIENISFYPSEKEVLFFPFSAFEIKDINKTIIDKEKGYEIQLVYLAKYIKNIKEDKKISKIPESEFKKQICEFGLLEKDKVEKMDLNVLYTIYKEYEKEIKKNIIVAEFKITKNDLDKNIQIINSFENFKRANNFDDNEDDWIYNNENEIKNNIEIKINGKKIGFSYYHVFEKIGKYKIEYISKNNLTHTDYLFADCSEGLISLDFSDFDTENVINMSKMFYFCGSLLKINLTNFNTTNALNLEGLFFGCNKLESLDLSDFNTKNANHMGGMFYDCHSLKSLDLSGFDTRNVNNTGGMFRGCENLTSLDLSKFDTGNVKNFGGMFYGCKSLVNLNVSSFNTENVKNFGGTFYDCKSLVNLDLSRFKIKSALHLGVMFSGCESLKYLNLSNFNSKTVINMSNMFAGCKSLKKEGLIVKDSKILEQLK